MRAIARFFRRLVAWWRPPAARAPRLLTPNDVSDEALRVLHRKLQYAGRRAE